MSAIEPAGEKAIQRLHEAVEQLREDIARVELWADALECFARPVPNYDPLESNLNKFALPSAARKQIATTAREPDSGAPKEAAKTAPKPSDFLG